jgi:Mg-chelatase subunit ChlD
MTDNVARLQSAADGALLAAATSGETEEANLEKVAREALDNLMDDGFSATAQFGYPEGKMEILAEMSYKPRLMGLFGFDDRTLRVNSAIPRGGLSIIDIALVLDVTQSMQGDKLVQMKAAVNNFITEFESSGGDIRVSIIPFSQYVNVGVSNQNQPWIDNSEAGTSFPAVTHTPTVTSATCQGGIISSVCTSFGDGVSFTMSCTVCDGGTTGETPEPVTHAPERAWDGCVGSRKGSRARQAFYGGSPFPAVYNDGNRGEYRDTHYFCPDEILPLTDNFTQIRDKVNALTVTGSTYMPSGLAWGWRTLDDDVPLGVPKAGAPRKKALILMTDGVNTVSRLGADKYHYGRASTSNNVIKDANKETGKICDNISSEDILLYTIAYGLPDTAEAEDTKIVLSDCASTPEGFFNAAGSANLNEAFKAIGQNLAAVRLVN